MTRNSSIRNFLVGIILTLASCNSSGEKIEPQQDLPQGYLSEASDKNQVVNHRLEQLAQVLAKIITDPEVRNVIQQEALKQQDGDYDISCQKIASHVFPDKLTLEEKIQKISKLDMRQIVSTIPHLQISVPMNCEEWKASSYVPLVAVAPQGINERELHSVKSFDSKGDLHWLSAKEDPAVPVIVVGISERTHSIAPYVYSYSGGRVDGGAEYIEGINIPSLRSVEPWIWGRPEIMVKVLSAKIGEVATFRWDNPQPNRAWVNNRWYYKDVFLFNWNRAIIGDFIMLKWYEEDGGDDVSTTVTFPANNGSPSVSYSISHKAKDNDMGQQIVQFTDGRRQEYSTGSIRWYHKFSE